MQLKNKQMFFPIATAIVMTVIIFAAIREMVVFI